MLLAAFDEVFILLPLGLGAGWYNQEWNAWYLGSAPSHPGLPGSSTEAAVDGFRVVEVTKISVTVCVVVLGFAVVEVAGHRGSLEFGTQTGGEGVVGHLGSVDPCTQIGGGCVVTVVVGRQRGSFDSGVHLKGGGEVSAVARQRGSFDPGIHLLDVSVVTTVGGQLGSFDPGTHLGGDCVVVDGVGHPGLFDPGVQIG